MVEFSPPSGAIPVLLVLSTLCASSADATERIRWAVGRGPPAEFDIQAFVDRAVRAGERRIVVPRGSYRVRPRRSQHLVLKGLRDVEIAAYGVEMICTETTRAITIADCANVRLRGMTIDYDPLPYSQGRIVSLSADKHVHEIELFEGYPPAEQVRNFKYEIFDRQTRRLRTRTYGLEKVERLSERRLRLTRRGRNERDPERLGDIIAIGSAFAPGGSAAHAVECARSRGVVLEDIRLYASNCFGFLEYDCDGTTYRRCRIDRRPPEDDLKERGDPRIRSLDADAFHSKHAVRGPRLVGCVARFQGDDGLNICGDYHMVTEANGRKWRVLAKRELNIEAGDPIEILTYDGRRLPDAKVLAIEPDGAINDGEKAFLLRQGMDEGLKTNRHGHLTKAFAFTIDREESVPTGTVICSTLRTGNGFLVEGCTFEYNRSRGILIKASDGRVVGNTLTGNWGEAILVTPEFWWLESGSSNNVIVSGNRIADCRSYGIEVRGYGGNRKVGPPGLHNGIDVTGNRLSGCPAPNIVVTATRNLLLRDNICTDVRGMRRGYGVREDSVRPVITINCEAGPGVREGATRPAGAR